MKTVLKRLLPVRISRQLRRLGRLRWMTKYQLLRAYGCNPQSVPMIAAKFVLLDPEVESHSFEIANEAELCLFLCRFFGFDAARVEAVLTEAKADPVLSRDRGFSLSRKRHPPLGRRLAWFIIARLKKPRLIVETGIYDGLGSEVLLRALQLNALEGRPGRLISFDIFADSGRAVAGELRGEWQRMIGSTFEILEPTLRGQRVDLFIRDTPPAMDHIRFEINVAIQNAGDSLTVIDSGGEGAAPVLREHCRLGAECSRVEVFTERTLHHVQPENRQAYAIYVPRIDASPDGPDGMKTIPHVKRN